MTSRLVLRSTIAPLNTSSEAWKILVALRLLLNRQNNLATLPGQKKDCDENEHTSSVVIGLLPVRLRKYNRIFATQSCQQAWIVLVSREI